MAQPKKIYFFELSMFIVGNPDIQNPQNRCREVLHYITTLPDVNRHMRITPMKFCRLETIADNQTYHNLMFKSAAKGYRAPLLDDESGAERDNPKTLSEGERVKTHLTIRYTNDAVYVCLESGQGSLKIDYILRYLNHFADRLHVANRTAKDYNFSYFILAKDDFLEELGNMNRVIEGEILVDKQILGSPALNYSDRINQVQSQIKITMKASRTQSIRETLIDIFNNFNGANSNIKKIKVIGKSEHDNNVLLDTEIIAKTEFVNTEIHEATGEVVSASIFQQLVEVIQTL